MPSQKFFWGTATSSHQSEGSNHNDWTGFETANAQRLASEAETKDKPVVPDWDAIKNEAQNPNNYISGLASDSYARFKEDTQIMKSLGVNAYRFSIEWSRILPQRGQVDTAQIQHYKEVIDNLRENDIEPFITIWHRSLPLWVAKQGGWENKQTTADFLDYTEILMQNFAKDVQYWMPINEANLYTGASYGGGGFPPAKNNLLTAYRVLKKLAEAQKESYKLIHRHRPDAKVGLPMAGVYVTPYKNKWYNKIIVRAFHFVANWMYINWVRRATDFIGVQYYRRGIIRLKRGGKFFLQIVDESNSAANRTDLGWEIYPQGIYEYIKLVWERYHIPIIVTENGIADKNDGKRADYITNHVGFMQKAQHEGMEVNGYFYWSLLDNLEWDKGFWPKFGLIEVSKQDETRKLRPSAQAYKNIIRHS